MRRAERLAWMSACGVLAVALGIASLTTERKLAAHAAARAVERPRASPGARLTMDALHRQGGVPLGWQPTLAPGNVAAGRAAFEALGCPACHRIAGETFASAVADPPGPELTGMGSHHPPAYFAEAILNPDAVLVEGPGWIDASGRSTMPAYDTITLGELSDLVAYLGSLGADAGNAAVSCHAGPASPATSMVLSPAIRDGQPAPPPPSARAYYAQTYDVLPGRLADFEHWFAERGRPGFASSDGVLDLATYVDASRARAALTTIVTFRDEAALRTFLGDPRTVALLQELDAYVGPHGHYTTDGPIVYRAPSLSAAQ
jgi:hypothetical protein